MSTRERWIVYPLLFMTLGIALRDKIVPPSRFGNMGLQLQANEITGRHINCNELHVKTVVCDRVDCHALLVDGPSGRPVVLAGTDPKTRAGLIETFAANGMPEVRIVAGKTGGT